MKRSCGASIGGGGGDVLKNLGRTVELRDSSVEGWAYFGLSPESSHQQSWHTTFAGMVRDKASPMCPRGVLMPHQQSTVQIETNTTNWATEQFV